MKQRILGIDYGLKRIGIAVSDHLHLTAQPYTTLENNGKKDVINKLKNIIEKEDIQTIVVGVPYHSDGNPSEMTEIILSFIEDLKYALSQKITTYNESYSSSDAGKILKNKPEKTKHHRNDKKIIDRLAAAVILQNYLDDL